MSNIVPNKSTSPSDKLDEGCVILLRKLLYNRGVKTRIEEGGTLPNIDGYLELLDEDDRIKCKLTVQIKHLTNPTKNGNTFYDIPQSIFGYADRMKGELVIFIACDTENEAFFWKEINIELIEDFKNCSNHIQNTRRHYFLKEERCDKSNVMETLSKWRNLFDEKMDSIKDDKKLAEEFAKTHRTPFENIVPTFGNIESHIIRNEVEKLIEWINNPLKKDKNNLCLLSGNAGVGKTIVIKDVISRLETCGINPLCIKADYLDTMSDDMYMDKIMTYIHYLSAGQKVFVIVIDQIDALSQYLSNDRKQINTLITLISNFKEKRDMRIIVSCRKYDLEYDYGLKSIQNNAKRIELGLLSQKDVENVLDKLEPGLRTRLNKKTISLLQTAQFLDIFCRIYENNREELNFENANELYDAFWKKLLNSAPISITQNSIEKTLFCLADLALECNTLSPTWSPAYETEQMLDYLASNGAIRREGHKISFFHQSFYDYTLAKHCVENDRDYIEHLENNFQGLEIRSTIKALLEYERDHNERKYIKDLNLILHSSKIRQHIKYLVLSMLAFSTKVLPFEKKVVVEVCTKDERLLAYFLRYIKSDIWFPVMKTIIRPIMKPLSNSCQFLIPIENCLSVSSYKYATEVFELVNLIHDENTKQDVTGSVLFRGHNNYKQKCIRDAFELIEHNTFYAINALFDALGSNKTFVSNKTEKRVKEYLLSDDKDRNGLNAHSLVEKLCKEFADRYPMEYLKMFHKCFLEMIEKKSQPCYLDGFTTINMFEYSMDDYTKQLLNIYKTLLARYASNATTIKHMVKQLLYTNNVLALRIAFETMAINPMDFDTEVVDILSDNEKTESYLHGDLEYYFLLLLKNWYIIQTDERKSWYENTLLSFKTKKDFLIDRERQFHECLYWNLGRNKWKLICCTLPEILLNENLRRCRQELIRRYKHIYISKEPDYDIPMASICGGLVPYDTYQKFSCDVWRRSFLNLNEKRCHQNKPISLRVHSDLFGKCVRNKPQKFKDFIFEIFDNEDIKLMYRIDGLKGLLHGGIDIDILWPLVQKLLSIEFVLNNYHDFSEIVEHYFIKDNKHIDELIPFMLEIIQLPEDEDMVYHYGIGNDKLSEQANEMLTKAINSPQGIAMKILLKLCCINERREYAYKLLNEIEGTVSDDIRLLVISYIFIKGYYDKALTTATFQKYIRNIGSVALAVHARVFQNYLYREPEVVTNYINRIESDSLSHNILCQIYFYGLTVYERAEYFERQLDKLLENNETEIVAKVVEICLKSFANNEYTMLAEKYLKRFADDKRDKVIQAYCWHCDELPIDAFYFFTEVYSHFKTNRGRDISYELKYISKCIVDYPVDCYKFILSQDYTTIEYRYTIDEEVVNVLFSIYKRLNEDSDIDSMNSLMDMFEELIYSSNIAITEKLENN